MKLIMKNSKLEQKPCAQVWCNKKYWARERLPKNLSSNFITSSVLKKMEHFLLSVPLGFKMEFKMVASLILKKHLLCLMMYLLLVIQKLGLTLKRHSWKYYARIVSVLINNCNNAVMSCSKIWSNMPNQNKIASTSIRKTL